MRRNNPYDVDFKINFVEVPTLKEAFEKQNQEKDRSTVLYKGGYKVKYTENGTQITLASTSSGELALNSSKSSHTNTHEFFHSWVHFSKNSPYFLDEGFDSEDQGPWHEKYGGIFSYKETLPLNQKNVNDAIKNTPTILEIPEMGPHTEEQQKWLDSNKVSSISEQKPKE